MKSRSQLSEGSLPPHRSLSSGRINTQLKTFGIICSERAYLSSSPMLRLQNRIKRKPSSQKTSIALSPSSSPLSVMETTGRPEGEFYMRPRGILNLCCVCLLNQLKKTTAPSRLLNIVQFMVCWI